MDIGPFLREVIYEYAGKVFGYAVTMNFQQPSSGSFPVFQQLAPAPAVNCENLVFGQFLQGRTLAGLSCLQSGKVSARPVTIVDLCSGAEPLPGFSHHILPWRRIDKRSQKPITPASRKPIRPMTGMPYHFGGMPERIIRDEPMTSEARTMAKEILLDT